MQWRLVRLFFPLSLLLVLAWITASSAAVPDFAELAAQLKPAVVNISTAKNSTPRTPQFHIPPGPGQDLFEDFFERFFRDFQGRGTPRRERSLGTGFIISADGYILTNDHVVDGADEIKVKLSDGREFRGEVRGLDPKLDLALVKIDTGEQLPVATLGDSDTLRVGEWVMAIGNPFGLEQTVTVGIVSAKGRVIGAGPYDDFIQTDASINPGNSGGPLFNARGEVVGINTAIVAGGQGIGFAIPVNMAKQIIPQLREAGHVVRGWLGVTIQTVTEELARSFGLAKAGGALVNEVIKDSPADKAGFRRGDIVLRYDGQTVETMNDLPRLVANTPVGTTVKVTLFRDGKQREVKVDIGELAEERAARAANDDQVEEALGLHVTELSRELAERYSLEPGAGVVISRIIPGGPAATANLQPGDLLLEIDGTPFDSVAGFRKLVSKAETGATLRLLVQRRQTLFYTTLTIK
ncbi:MAG: DegQ family serine endoprotease [Desulfuromonadales bacterium]|nr:DegQ family serine endoprotease [Desulfuromonadales bacterium]